jgi:hypothetical protein
VTKKSSKPLPVSSPGPTKADPKDLEPLKQMILEMRVTFEGAERGRCVGLGDKEAVLKAAQEYVSQGYVAWAKIALTLSHRAYWSLYDEQQAQT